MNNTSTHQAKKRFGQNFLKDRGTIDQIIQSINPHPGETFIEIGPGLGALTIPMLKRIHKIDVIELDRDIIPKLIEACHSLGELNIHQCDVLKFNFEEFINKSTADNKLRIIGNLPYNISTAVLFHLLHSRQLIKDMHFMLQKEVVERIAALPGNRIYGRLSVMIQSYFKVSPLFTVPASAFSPAPKVESAILRLTPDSTVSDQIIDHRNYEKLVRLAFSQRRKTLSNTLKLLCSHDQIVNAGLDPGLRAEALSVEDFIRLHRQTA